MSNLHFPDICPHGAAAFPTHCIKCVCAAVDKMKLSDLQRKNLLDIVRAPASGIVAIAGILEGYRYNISTELELQNGIEQALSEAGLPVSREVSIGRDRIDFMVNAIGIEVKTAGSAASVTRQLHRYAQSALVDALLLVTTRSLHNQMPESLNGKPVQVLHLLRSALG